MLMVFSQVQAEEDTPEGTISEETIPEETIPEETIAEVVSDSYDEAVLEFEGMINDVDEALTVEPLRTKKRKVEVIATEEFFDYMYNYPGLIEKIQAERLASRSPYVLLPHKPNYFMPLTYQARVHQGEQESFYNAVSEGNALIDSDPSFEQAEFVFQLSVKYIVADNFLGKFSSLAVAYTNKSFWQSYNDSVSALFRETNHEPEIILGFKAFDEWVNHWTLAFNHQSNGQVGSLSRSWNRIILGATKIWPNKILYGRVWYRIPEDKKSDPMESIGDDNPDIQNYVGYGDLFYLSKFGNHSISATLRNNLRLDHNRGSIEIDWTYPLPGNVKGFIQYFNGYGESLIDYNQYQERIGIGIKITDWL